PALDQISLEHAEMLKEKNAVEVVNLVAESAGQQPLAAHFINFALYILRTHGHVSRAQNVSAEPGQRQAPFLFTLVSFHMNDLRIGKDHARLWIFSHAYVNHSKPFGQPDLRGR